MIFQFSIVCHSKKGKLFSKKNHFPPNGGNDFHLEKKRSLFPSFNSFDDMISHNLGTKYDFNGLDRNLTIWWERIKSAQIRILSLSFHHLVNNYPIAIIQSTFFVLKQFSRYFLPLKQFQQFKLYYQIRNNKINSYIDFQLNILVFGQHFSLPRQFSQHFWPLKQFSQYFCDQTNFIGLDRNVIIG